MTIPRAWILGATLALSLACSSRDDGSSPEAAVRSLIAAARAGDRLAVYQRFGPHARAVPQGRRGGGRGLLGGRRSPDGARRPRGEELEGRASAPLSQVRRRR